jgi:hypothetical protein
MQFTLELLAAHKLNVAEAVTVAPIGTAYHAQLTQQALERIDRYVQDMDERDEGTGKASALWWQMSEPIELQTLRTCPSSEFDVASFALMQRLQAVTPGTATSGVMIFVRGTRDDGGVTLAAFKMALKAVEYTMFDPNASAAEAITVRQLENVLPEPKDLAKAALVPHPAAVGDLRVVDVNTPIEPAGYWLKFLGAEPTPSQPQVKKLVYEAGQRSLEQAGVAAGHAQDAIAQELQAAQAPLRPRSFLEAVAQRAGASPTAVWSAVVESQPLLAAPHASISQDVAKATKVSLDFGNGLVLSGPATEMRSPQVAIGQDAHGSFVTIRSAAPPVRRAR